MTVTELQELARILPDELAWDTLARAGWRLVDYWIGDRMEVWAKEGEWERISRRRGEA